MKDKKLDVLLHEHALINKKIDDFINSQFLYISTLLTLASSFIFIAYQSKEVGSRLHDYVQYLPYILIIIGPTFLFKFNRAIILHGYRCSLEERINKAIGKNVIVGGYLVKRKLLGRNLFAIMNYTAMIALCLVSIYFCHKYQAEFFNVNFIIQSVFVIIGVVSFIILNNKAFISGYQFSKDLYHTDHNFLEQEQ